jgi:two-component system, OmpR family, response regulator RegX3
MKVALLEDDGLLAELVTEWLVEASYEVVHFRTGLDFIRKYPNDFFDICLFDWMLPDMQGLDVMISIMMRAKKIPPIIFLTGRSDEADIVRVIDAGADDYLVKPVSKALLLSRMNAVLRRVVGRSMIDTLHEYGNLKFDIKERLVYVDGEEAKLTDKEFDLALYFVRNEGSLLSRTHLMHVVWGASSDIETRKVDVHVSHLRTKLKLTPENGWKLTSIYQQGYRLEGYG